MFLYPIVSFASTISSNFIVSLLRVHQETKRRSFQETNKPYQFSILRFWKICFQISPQTLGNIDVLLFVLNHLTPLPPQRDHNGQDGQLLHVRVEVVEPELVHHQEYIIYYTLLYLLHYQDNIIYCKLSYLVHHQERSSSSHPGATVHQDFSWTP